MGIFDWMKGKSSKQESPTTTARPAAKILAEMGPDSPFIVVEMGNGGVMLTDRETYEYQNGLTPGTDPRQSDLAEVLAKVTRVKARSGGLFRGEAMESPVLLDVSDEDALAAFRRCFEIIEDPQSFSHCGCLGGPTLQLLAGHELIAVIGLQHGSAIRWKDWRHDAELRHGDLLTEWLKAHGIHGDLLAILFQNPFAMTGGKIPGRGERPLSRSEQRVFLAEIQAERGGEEAALAECESVLAEDPECVRALAYRGQLRKKRGDRAGAVKDFNAAIAMGESTAEIHFVRAVTLDELGLPHQAIEDCTKAIEIDPNHANSWNSRGVVRMTLGQFEESRDDLEKAKELAPGWDLPCINLAQLSMFGEDWEQAVIDLTHVITSLEAKRTPEDHALLAMLYWNRGKARTELGQTQEALADLKSAKNLDPNLGAPG